MTEQQTFAESLSARIGDNTSPHVRRIVAAVPDAALSGGPAQGRTYPLPDDRWPPPTVVYLQKACDPGSHITLHQNILGYEYRLQTYTDGKPVILPNRTIHYLYAQTNSAQGNQ